jgi:predicted amidohydrolase
MARLTLALAQITTRLGDPEANLEKHLAWIEEARAKGADLIVFPELSLTGYVLQDLTPTVARPASPEDPLIARLLTASRKIDVLFGFVEADPRSRFHISAAYLSRGEIVHIHRKLFLPTYGLFDEGRFFAQGDAVRAFDTRFGRFGVLICEDFWHASPPYLLWLDGADVMLLISASPGRGLNREDRLDSARWVEQINQAYASLFTTFVAHTNRVGFEDGLNFWGGATLYDPDGFRLAHGPYFQEALTVAEIDLAQLRRTRARLPLLRDERPGMVERELARILRSAGRAAEE